MTVPVVHALESALHDEDWCARCTCGAEFFARYRPDAEGAVAAHIIEEGIAASRAAIEQGLRGGDEAG